VAFGTLAIVAKLAYRAGADPLPLLATRFTLASGLLFGWHLITKRTVRVGKGNVARLLLLGALGYGLESFLFFAALQHAPAAAVALIFYSYPVWTTVLALGTGLERFRPAVAAALVLACAGIVVVFSYRPAGTVGPLLALGSALSLAVYLLLSQLLVRDVAASAAATWTSTGASVGLVSASVASGGALPRAALPLAVALGLASALAFGGLYAAIARIGSTRAAVAGTSEPVTTVLLAAIVLGNSLSARVVVGTVLIAAALPILAMAGRPVVPGTKV
jgi:drug/metabolite transporter (DMT)-like permease